MYIEEGLVIFFSLMFTFCAGAYMSKVVERNFNCLKCKYYQKCEKTELYSSTKE